MRVTPVHACLADCPNQSLVITVANCALWWIDCTLNSIPNGGAGLEYFDLTLFTVKYSVCDLCSILDSAKWFWRCVIDWKEIWED